MTILQIEDIQPYIYVRARGIGKRFKTHCIRMKLEDRDTCLNGHTPICYRSPIGNDNMEEVVTGQVTCKNCIVELKKELKELKQLMSLLNSYHWKTCSRDFGQLKVVNPLAEALFQQIAARRIVVDRVIFGQAPDPSLLNIDFAEEVDRLPRAALLRHTRLSGDTLTSLDE